MILVTGATGNVGRHVVSLLLEAGEDFRALSRSPEGAELPAGANVVRGDLLDRLGRIAEAIDAYEALETFYGSSGPPPAFGERIGVARQRARAAHTDQEVAKIELAVGADLQLVRIVVCFTCDIDTRPDQGTTAEADVGTGGNRQSKGGHE